MSKSSPTVSRPKAKRRLGTKRTKKAVDGQFEVYGHITQAQLDASLARIRKLTQTELVQSLKDTGILTPTGRLAKRYRSA